MNKKKREEKIYALHIEICHSDMFQIIIDDIQLSTSFVGLLLPLMNKHISEHLRIVDSSL